MHAPGEDVLGSLGDVTTEEFSVELPVEMVVGGPTGWPGETATLSRGECPPEDAPPAGNIEVVCTPPVGEYMSPVS